MSCLGHSDQTVISAIKRQLDSLGYAHTSFFTSAPAEELADLLIKHAPGDLDRVYLVSGGSEAMEAVLKLARQYFVEKGEDRCGRIIARKQSYHGNTMGALSAGGNAWRRAKFGPLLIDMSHIDPCYEHRLKRDGESLEEDGFRAANLLEEKPLRVSPENVMAFAAEPVVGSTAGALAAAPGYFKRIREICDQYGILLILDEVMCGMGRTGSLFACEQEGVAPDNLCIAKGLSAGYQPIGAMLCTREIYETIENGSGFFQHGHTYLGHPTAAAAGVAVVKAMLDRNLIARVKTQGEKLMAALQAQFGQHPNVGDIRGRGLFQGIELVAHRDSKVPFEASRKIASRIKSAAFDAGLICYPMGGTTDGQTGDHVLFAPPFIFDDSQIDKLVIKLSVAIETSLQP